MRWFYQEHCVELVRMFLIPLTPLMIGIYNESKWNQYNRYVGALYNRPRVRGFDRHPGQLALDGLQLCRERLVLTRRHDSPTHQGWDWFFRGRTNHNPWVDR